jgi:low affinity Fe/Cu permease
VAGGRLSTRQRRDYSGWKPGTTHLAVPPLKPKISLFDRLAESASEFASHAVFFIACLLLVIVWAPSYFVFGSLNTWQLVINTATTIVTFLLVALLQNSQRRSDLAVHEKLDALADGLADLMDHVAADDDSLRDDMIELRHAVGIEHTD